MNEQFNIFCAHPLSLKPHVFNKYIKYEEELFYENQCDSNDVFFSGKQKVYVQGSRPDIQVPMREISLSPTETMFGKEENKPVRVYDTSGPYTDPNYEVDLKKGFQSFAESGFWKEEMLKNIRADLLSLRTMVTAAKMKQTGRSRFFQMLTIGRLERKKGVMLRKCIMQERESLPLRWSSLRLENSWILNLSAVR